MGRGINPAGFPSGLSSVPVMVKFQDGSKFVLDLVAGFLAVQQDPSDLALSPVIGWSVAEPQRKPPAKTAP